jgi:phosphoribosyl 1,2-cyclic phosphodiesterase
MTRSDDFMVRFWGVRGSIATPGAQTMNYGGNTPCVEVRCGRRIFILDSGTGVRPLGGLLAGEMPFEADFLLSHTHYDHVIGLPFFAPAFVPGNRLRVWAGHLGAQGKIQQVLGNFMSAPFFPIPTEVFRAAMSYKDFLGGDVLDPGDGVTIRTAPLNHPNGATGYRIEFGGHCLAYVTDTEHTKNGLDKNVLGLIGGADLVIYDSTYTDEEYPRFAGWGHSTWQEGVRLCDQAKAGTLALFHHDPSHDDDFMDRVASDADRLRPGTIVAREGLVLRPGQR